MVPTNGTSLYVRVGFTGVADDLAELLEKLDLKEVTLVGHSGGGGEVARYIGHHCNKRVKKAVIIGGIPPVMLKSDKNPGGLPMSVFDGIRTGLVADRSQFYKDVSMPFYGSSRMPSPRRVFVIISGSRECSLRSSPPTSASRPSRRQISRKISKRFKCPHWLFDSAELSSKIVKNATLKVIPGAPHGLCTTHADQINGLLLDFLKA
jgi:non-heme chloroperoxidase